MHTHTPEHCITPCLSVLSLCGTQFDNFQFVNFHEVMTKPRVENYDVEFAVAALQEIPDQWLAIRNLRLV